MKNAIQSKKLIIKSKIPGIDYVINPYLGCTHACSYCYAEFMNKFHEIKKPWGSYSYPKEWKEDLKETIKNITGKSLMFGSATDSYQPLEGQLALMRQILPLFIDSGVKVEILTKSPLILRDLDIIDKIEDIKIGMSICTLDKKLHNFIETTPSPQKRLETLLKLKNKGIPNFLFVAPIFPKIGLTKRLIAEGSKVANKVLFDKLNLRGKNKARILQFVKIKYPEHLSIYQNLYQYGDNSYWEGIKSKIINECDILGMNYKILF